MSDLAQYDCAAGSSFGFPVCGIDEAGRGPLAGDVYAAAVVLPPDCIIDGLNDSKKLTAKKRESLYDIICEKALSFCIQSASVQEIEQHNILGASMLAMRRAYDGLDLTPALILLDGNQLTGFEKLTARAVVGGDALSQSIAAASVLAKVARDRVMVAAHEMYPQYGFKQHKGYGTAQHIAAIRAYGPCPLHRALFVRKFI